MQIFQVAAIALLLHLIFGNETQAGAVDAVAQAAAILGAVGEDVAEVGMGRAAAHFGKQNPRRIIVESYVKILEFEGRLHGEPYCFLCDEEILENIALCRSFLPAHESCAQRAGFAQDEILEFLRSKKTLNLNDETVERLYDITLEGL